MNKEIGIGLALGWAAFRMGFFGSDFVNLPTEYYRLKANPFFTHLGYYDANEERNISQLFFRPVKINVIKKSI